MRKISRVLGSIFSSLFRLKPVRVLLNTKPFRIFKRIIKKIWFWRGVSRRNNLAFIIFSIIVIGFSSLYIFNLLFPQSGEASWFNTDWAYRKSIDISAHTAAESNVYINLAAGAASGGPTKISDSSNFGASLGSGSNVVRTASGVLYVVTTGAPAVVSVWRSTDGTSWTEQDSGDRPTSTSTRGPDIAIDGSGIIHILYTTNAAGAVLKYITFNTSTNQYGTAETINTPTGQCNSVANQYVTIAVDSNSFPHVFFVDCPDASTETVYYSNRISGSWKAKVTVANGVLGFDTFVYLSAAIDQNNLPMVLWVDTDAGVLDLYGGRGTANDASTFSLNTSIDTSVNATANQQRTDLAVDSSNNTWVAYLDENGATDNVVFKEHLSANSWTTSWTGPVTNSNAGFEPSIAIDSNDIYQLYEQSSTHNIDYDRYNGSTWTGQTILQTGTRANVKTRRATYFNASNSTYGIDYTYDDGTDMYWASKGLSAGVIDTSDTSKFQADCGDLRFTDQNGDILPYYIVSGCGTSTTLVHVFMADFPAGAQTIYYYYGNPSAPNGFSNSDFSTSATGVTLGNVGSEEIAPGPVAYWKFDDGTGLTAADSTSTRANGALTPIGTGGPTKIDDVGDPGSLDDSGNRQIVRTSSGTIYAFINDGGSCEIWKSTDGSSFTEQDSAHHPTCSTTLTAGLAIDGNNTLHLVYLNAASSQVKYITFNTSTDLFGTEETAGVISSCISTNVAVDSNNVPHMVCRQSGNPSAIIYANRVGGSWNATVTVESVAAINGTGNPSLAISEDDIPEISYNNVPAFDLTAAVGNANNATSFTLQDVDTQVASSTTTSIAIDSAGNTWIGYSDDLATDFVTLIEHLDGDPWSTWQTPVNNSNDGRITAISIKGSSIYQFYIDASDSDLKYDVYNGSTWAGSITLQTGTFQQVKPKMSTYFNNQGNTQIDYLYSDSTDNYWASIPVSTGPNSMSWQAENQCISGKCINFQGGTTGSVTVSKTVNGVKSIGMWVRPASASAALIDLGNGKNITIASNIVTTENITSPTIYVNGQVGTNTVANQWNYIEVTTGTSITASGIKMGNVKGDFLSGFMDEVRLYDFTRSASEIKADFNSQGSPDSASNNLSASILNIPNALSNGLAGYWKLDESSGNAADSSGNSLTLTNNSSTSYATGKFFNAGSFVAASTDYFSTATTINGIKTVAFWVNPSATTDEFINLTSSAYITASSGTVSATGFTSPKIYVNGALNGTLTASTWNHVVVTTDTAINANQFEVGRANGAYTNGLIDDVRVYNRALSAQNISSLYGWSPTPVAYYSFEDGYGSSLSDFSSNGNTGTWNGTPPYWTYGRYGKAGTFNGSDSFVDLTSAPINGSGSFSIFAWVKTSNTGTRKDIFSTGNNVSNNDAVHLFINTSNQIEADVTNAAGPTSTATVTDGSWHYVGVVNNAGTFQIYVDGIASGSTSSLSPNLGSSLARIGRTVNSSSNTFNGSIDEVRVFNYAVDPKQIVSTMNAYHPAVGSPVSSPLEYLKLDDGYGNVASNSGSLGATGRVGLINMANPSTVGSGWNQNGKYNKALAFDGVNDYATTGDLFYSDTLSVCAWVSGSVLDANSRTIVTKRNSGNITTGTPEWSLAVENGKVTWTAWSGATVVDFVGSTTLSTNTWYHICAVQGGNGSPAYIYLNGKQDGTAVQSGAMADTSSLIQLGVRTSANDNRYWTGKIDEVKIYNYALSASDVLVDYNRGSSLVLGALSDTSGLTGGSVASNSANAQFCVPGGTDSCAPPIGEWQFETKLPTVATDTSGNNNNGSITAATYQPGAVGSDLQFDGTNSFVDLGNNSTGSIFNFVSNPFSISFWIKPQSSNAEDKIINRGLTATNGFTVQLLTDGSGTRNVSFSVWHIGTDTIRSTTTLPLNKWTHVEITKSGANAKIYLNGVLDTSSGGFGNAGTNARTLYFGQYDDGTDRITGGLDQVRIYDYERTYAQVAWEFNHGGPSLFYKLDECQGNFLNNSVASVSASPKLGINIGSSGSQTTTGTCLTPTDGTGAWYNGRVGKYNSSMSFDGTDDWISTPTTLGPGSSYSTVAVWFKAAAGNSCILSILGQTAPSTGYNHCAFALNGTSLVLVWPTVGGLCLNAGNSNITMGTITTGQWYHALATYEGGVLKAYLNGRLVGTDTITPCTPGNLFLGIGTAESNSIGSATGYFSGQIDDVRLYTYPMPAAVVRTVYNQGSAVRFGPITGTPQ